MLSHIAEYYEVHFEDAPPLLRGRVLRPLSATEFTESCELLLAQALRHDCSFWLLDGRADENIRSNEVYEWLTEEFLPRVRKALDRVPCLAFLARSEFWQALQAHAYAPPPPVLLSAAFRANWFTEEIDALAWLNALRNTPARAAT